MPLAITHLKQMAAEAGFTRKGMLAWGLRRGFPVLFQFDKQNMKNPVAITARLAPGSPTDLPATFAPPLDALLGARAAQTFAQGDTAVLLLQNGLERLKRGEFLPAVDSFLGGLESTGMQPQRACGLCGATENLSVLSSDNSVGLICPACLAKQAAQYDDLHGYVPSSLPKLLTVGVASFVGMAALWAALAIGVDLAFDAAGGSAKLPGKLTILLAFLLGMAVAVPALLFKLVPRRGRWPAMLCAAIAGLLAIFAGEIICADWFLRRRGVETWLPPLSVVWNLASSGSGFFLTLRAILTLSTVGAAAYYAKPPAPKLSL